ncbi:MULTISPECIES: MarR family winged helix-turn-helix transcriptional regulator [Enterobacteriaceae]|uniref:MarR family winged helix-turn-helix transcriptional regulator n=1 Tax=Enterobacteriaceae TaxID=543 RepID=UPI0007B395F4|nr:MULTISPECIES: MarR family transcriptional regulator [Enterobacteriaceae]HDL6904401.1 MarR family transcriptional regulator [Yersinia enterocolitica]KZP57540.1 MarR family transcriptional regulator [Enterobacter ludwigii]MEB7546925.1 MarR family transcriptional regulator [Klebsiella grimontii]HDL6909005.1 MarR family transcriptional regulator [Yersinia enterocolitica]HDL6990162.1 MarR family transcriptional regulator [Yersinia enterocolitica]
MTKEKKSVKQAPASDDGLADALVTTAFVTMAVINKIGAENDLSLSLIRVLGILWDRRPRMTELADYLGLEKQTMSGLIARAEKRGLVARAPNEEDGRATDVFLTSDGAKLVKRLRVQGQQALAPIIEQLSAPDQQLLQELLQRMLKTRES